MEKENKTAEFWNGKNIAGKSFVGDQNLIEETNRKNSDKLMKYEVGVDTFSADDLQEGVNYDIDDSNY